MTFRSDEEVIAAYNEFIKENPYATRHKIQLALRVGLERLDRLVKLPPKLSKSQSGTLARKQGGWGKHFRLRGSPKL